MAAQVHTEELWTPANKVTMVRILLVPVFVAVLIAPWSKEAGILEAIKPWFAAAIFIALSATDALDGYLARSRGEVTDFGKFADPLADKLLVAAALLGLIELGVLPSWVALIIISREFIVSGVRMVAASKGEVIAASWYGKVKTVLQMIAIVLFIVKDSYVITDFNLALHDGLYVLSWLVMLAAIVMTILSMVDYVYKARHLIGFGSSRSRKRAMQAAVENDLDNHEEELIEMLLSSEELAASVVQHAREQGVTIATAESCTGGLVAGTITSVAGSSDVFEGSVVSYSNQVKMKSLGVDVDVLDSFGAVSEAVACQMAEGARSQLGVDYAVSLTGIAGPGGGSADKPVGTVWIGIASARGSFAELHRFDGDRSSVREHAVIAALFLLDKAMFA